MSRLTSGTPCVQPTAYKEVAAQGRGRPSTHRRQKCITWCTRLNGPFIQSNNNNDEQCLSSRPLYRRGCRFARLARRTRIVRVTGYSNRHDAQRRTSCATAQASHRSRRMTCLEIYYVMYIYIFKHALIRVCLVIRVNVNIAEAISHICMSYR